MAAHPFKPDPSRKLPSADPAWALRHIGRLSRRLGLAAVLGLHGAAWCTAEVVTIDWGSHQRFDLQRNVAPGQVLEVCGSLVGGQGVQWHFTSSQPVAFNIHHHIGKQVFHAVQRRQTRGLTQRFVPDETNTYCWMWTAPAKAPASVVLTLRR